MEPVPDRGPRWARSRDQQESVDPDHSAPKTSSRSSSRRRLWTKTRDPSTAPASSSGAGAASSGPPPPQKFFQFLSDLEKPDDEEVTRVPAGADEEQAERHDARFQGDPAMEPPDWSQSEGEDFWDISGGRVRGQCRVHVRPRLRLFDPRGSPGSLPGHRYTGQRVTVVTRGDRRPEAYRDNFLGHSGPRES